MVARQNLVTAAAALAILAVFVVFGGDGLRAYFTPDDMMNLYQAWSPPLSDLIRADRPLAAFVYRGLFALFKLNPMPYRAVSMGLLVANLWLLYLFCVQLAGSREVAALACLLGAYHARLADLYYSTGTIYDLLCCFFLLLLFVHYFGIRNRGVYPDWRQNAVLLALYGCALGSKEMAVAAPALIAVYEALYHGRKAKLRSMLFLWVAAPLTLAYIAAKTVGAGSMTANPAYAIDLSAHAFLAGWRHYLTDFFYGFFVFKSFKIILLGALMLAFALAVRRKSARFALAAILIGALPVVFVRPRGLYAMYAALPAWYLYLAEFLVWARDALARRLPRWAPALEGPPGRWILFVLVLAVLAPLHYREKPGSRLRLIQDQSRVRKVMASLPAGMRPGSRVLFLADPYPREEWMLTFIVHLYYHDDSIRVDRANFSPELAREPRRSSYDHLFMLDDAGLREVAK